MSQVMDMTRGKPSKLILKFAFPLILANMGQQLYMIVDTAIVGRGVGVKALAAVGATDWSYWLILWSIITLTQGFSTFVSRYFGSGDYRKMNKAISTSVILSGIVGILLTIAGLIAAKPLLALLGTPKDIFDSAAVYLMTMVAGTIAVTAYNMAASILRAFGDGKSPLIAMVIAALVNVALDLLFVLVFRWGVFGAALASVLAQAVSFVYCFFRIRRIECVKLDAEAWKIDWKMMRDLILFGIPLVVQYVIICIGGIILQSAINGEGSIFIAGYTATNKLYGLLECAGISTGTAISTYFSQNYGAGQMDRVRSGVRSGVKIVTVMALVVMTLVFIFRKYMLMLFLDISQPGGEIAMQNAMRYMAIITICLPLLFFLHIYRNILQAIGVSVWSMVSGFSEFAARVIMSKAVILWIGTDSIFLAEPVSWLGALLCVMLPYYFYYRKRLMRKAGI